MIKTRLVGLLSHAKVYRVHDSVAVGGASVAGDRGIYGRRSAGTGRVWCGNGSGCETDDFYTGNCCCDPLFLRADGRAVVVSCVCGCETDSA